MLYAVSFKASALKQTGKLPKNIADRIFAKADSLANNPRPSGGVKLAGAGDLWRIRVGNYRIVYVIDDDLNAVDIRIVAHRREVYRQ